MSLPSPRRPDPIPTASASSLPVSQLQRMANRICFITKLYLPVAIAIDLSALALIAIVVAARALHLIPPGTMRCG